jgi:hypothetical protein
MSFSTANSNKNTNSKNDASASLLPIYVGKGFIKLDKFFRYVKDFSLGQLHKELTYVKRVMDDEWYLTFENNTNSDFKHLCGLFKKVKIVASAQGLAVSERGRKFNTIGEKRKQPTFHAQMFEGLKATFQIPERLTTTLLNVGTAASSISNTADSISGLTNQVRGLLDAYQTALSGFCVSVRDKLIPFCDLMIKLLSIGYLLSIKQNQTLPAITAIVALILPSGGGNLLVSGLNRVVQGINGGCFAQANDEEPLVAGIWHLIRDIFGSLFTDIPADRLNKMKMNATKLKLITDTIRGLSTVTEIIIKVFERVINYFGEKVLKYYGVLPSFMKQDILSPLVDEFVEIKIQQIDRKSSTNKHAAKQILVLYEKLVHFEKEYIKTMGRGSALDNSRVLPYLRIMVRSLEDTVRKIPEHLKTGKNPRRVKPFWVYIYGMPRVGKTAVFQPYLINALAKRLSLREKYEDYSNYTYFRNCGDEYWEKYSGQPVLWYNDLFQNFRDEQAMNNAVMELTNVIDDNLYNLNMAFEDKGAIFFDSELVISNAQSDLVGLQAITSLCLSNGSHLYARRNICCEFKLNTKYQKSDQTIDGELVKTAMDQIDVQTIGGLFPRDMYEVVFHDVMTGAPIKTLFFDDAVAYICDEAYRAKYKQTAFKDKLYDHFEDLWEKEVYKAQGDEYDFRMPCNCGLTLTKAANAIAFGALYCNTNHFLNTATLWLKHHIPNGWGCLDNDMAARLVVYWQNGFNKSVKFTHNTVNPPEYCPTRYSDVLVNQPSYAELEDRIRNLAENLVSDNDTYITSAHYRGDIGETIVKNFYIRNRNVDERLYAQISVAVTLSEEAILENYQREDLQQTFWSTFSKKAKLAVTSLLDQMGQYVNSHPRLCYFAMVGTLFAVSQGFIIFNAMKNIRAEQLPVVADTSVIENTFSNEVMADLKRQQPIQRVVAAEAQTSEGANIAPRRRVVRRTAKAQAYDQGNRDIESKIVRQIVKIGCGVYHDGVQNELTPFGTALCVGGDVFVMPRHFALRLEAYNNIYADPNHDRFYVYFEWNKALKQEVPFSNLEFWDSKYAHHEDIIFVRIPNICQMTDLSKFFVSENDEVVLFGTYLYGKRAGQHDITSSPVNRCTRREGNYVQDGRADPVYGLPIQPEYFKIPVCYAYSGVQTLGGDCGLMLLNSDSSTNCRKILGMHTAGSPQISSGLASPLFMEDIKEAIEHFKPLIKVSHPLIGGEPTTALKAQLDEVGLLAGTGTGKFQIPRLHGRNEGPLRPVKFCINGRSTVQPSIMFDAMEEIYGPSTVAPAVLGPYKKDGVQRYPMLDAAKKMVRVSNCLPKAEVEPIVNHMWLTFLSWTTSAGTPRVLTDDEMINGYGAMKKLDLSTSAGFPYQLISTNGKRFFFIEKDNKFYMNTFVEEMLNQRLALAKQGKFEETIFVDALKSETRPLEKVAEGKTRMFQVAPMDYNMLLRKYFGAFISMCHENYIDGEMAIGINALSNEWTKLAQRLLNMGTKVLAGDCSNYDASVPQPLVMDMCDAINRWYDDGEENALVRRVLLSTFLNSVDVIEDYAYTTIQGNKSGISLTTIINCMVGMFIFRLAYLRTFGSLVHFHDDMACSFYGDDVIATVREEISHLMTPDVIARAYESCGFTYTTIEKTGANTKFYRFEDTTFLQRKFVWDPEIRQYKGALNEKTILEIVRWSESDPDNMDDQLNRINASLLELSNYSYKMFNKYREDITNICRDANEQGWYIDITKIFDWNYCNMIKYPEIYGSHDPFKKS